MTPAARLQATIELTEKIWDANIPMDRVCDDYFRQRRHIGSKDRRDIKDRIYSMMRHHARLAWWGVRVEDESIRVRTFMHAVLLEVRTVDELNTLCAGGKYDPPVLSESELKALETTQGQAINHPDMPDAVRLECPSRHERWLRDKFGENFETAMQAMQEPAPIDLRVNTLKCTREKARDYLKAENVVTEITQYSPWGLRVKGKSLLSVTKTFNKGWVEVQDEGSQLIALLCEAKPGENVLDYCAGAGGKTLALAGMMNNTGRIFAADMDKRRLERGQPRYKKAGAEIVELKHLGDTYIEQWLFKKAGYFDCVLVDAPCSSSGTWNRNPDLRWRQHGLPLEELLTLQAEILMTASKLVKSGGRLVYATCSINPQENEEQIQRFIATQSGFSLTPEEGFPYDYLSKKGFFAQKLVKK